MNIAPIFRAAPQIQIHLATALAAFAIGGFILMNAKGTRLHKTLGWVYVALMTVVAGSAIFIHSAARVGMANIAGFTPIHLFVVITAVSLPSAIYHIKRGDVKAHRDAMIGLFVGGLVIAGALTLLPGRLLHTVFLGD
ncbi:MAG: DUF2306 domain-containing protein [Alphaproteobacteria bacterium]|nr:DUF2306 domain-containing protein [Alphaproteobacteria bacterium]